MKKEKKLSKQAMKELGFEELWPCGNPTEPWWENEEFHYTLYKRPTAHELIMIIQREAMARGVQETRDGIKKALGI